MLLSPTALLTSHSVTLHPSVCPQRASSSPQGPLRLTMTESAISQPAIVAPRSAVRKRPIQSTCALLCASVRLIQYWFYHTGMAFSWTYLSTGGQFRSSLAVNRVEQDFCCVFVWWPRKVTTILNLLDIEAHVVIVDYTNTLDLI